MCHSNSDILYILSRSIILSNDIKNVPQLNGFVDEVCQTIGFDSMTTKKVRLAVEEAVVNVMGYAYPTGTTGSVGIAVIANNGCLKFTITDSGKPFDPTSRPEVDVNLPWYERPIGGLGIHLVRQMMDSVSYNRIDGKNILTLCKNFEINNK